MLFAFLTADDFGWAIIVFCVGGACITRQLRKADPGGKVKSAAITGIAGLIGRWLK